jgi:clathrin heavy chain
MESEKYICIREQAATPDGKGQIVIVELANPSNPTRRPITADSAIMNPTQNILALKGMRLHSPTDGILYRSFVRYTIFVIY